MRLKIVGDTTLAKAWRSPEAPSICPVLSEGTLFVREDCNEGEPMPPKDAIIPDNISNPPVGAKAYPM